MWVLFSLFFLTKHWRCASRCFTLEDTSDFLSWGLILDSHLQRITSSESEDANIYSVAIGVLRVVLLYPSCDSSFLPTAPGEDFCRESLEVKSGEASFSLVSLDSSSTSATHIAPLYWMLLLSCLIFVFVKYTCVDVLWPMHPCFCWVSTCSVFFCIAFITELFSCSVWPCASW